MVWQRPASARHALRGDFLRGERHIRRAWLGVGKPTADRWQRTTAREATARRFFALGGSFGRLLLARLGLHCDVVFTLAHRTPPALTLLRADEHTASRVIL